MSMTRIKPDTLEQTMAKQYEEWKEKMFADDQLYAGTMEIFEHYLEELEGEDEYEVLELFNTYRENQGEPLLYYNEDYTLDEHLKTPSIAIKAADEGEFSYYDNFISFSPLTSYYSIPYSQVLGEIFMDIIDFPHKYDVDLIEISKEYNE